MSDSAVKIWPDSAFPKPIVDYAPVRGGLRFVQLGEDGETWVFLGHAYNRDVLAAIEVINREDGYGWDAEDLPAQKDLTYTYAQMLPTDPERVFGDTGEDGWSLDWSGGGEDCKANRGKPGYFPVVIWDAEG